MRQLHAVKDYFKAQRGSLTLNQQSSTSLLLKSSSKVEIQEVSEMDTPPNIRGDSRLPRIYDQHHNQMISRNHSQAQLHKTEYQQSPPMDKRAKNALRDRKLFNQTSFKKMNDQDHHIKIEYFNQKNNPKNCQCPPTDHPKASHKKGVGSNITAYLEGIENK